MKTLLLLLTLSSLLPVLMPQAAWSNSKISETRKQLLAQIDRPSPNGGCQNHRGDWVENCFQGVQWEQVPNSRTFVGGYDEDYSWIGTNTISRNGDAVNFDFSSTGGYFRYSANCNTRVYATVLASDSFVDPNAYSPVNDYIGRALDFACSVSELELQSSRNPTNQATYNCTSPSGRTTQLEASFYQGEVSEAHDGEVLIDVNGEAYQLPRIVGNTPSYGDENMIFGIRGSEAWLIIMAGSNVEQQYDCISQ